VREPDGKSLGALPTASGAATRLAYAYARERGLALEPLLKKAGLTESEVRERGVRINVRHQIDFLNLVADEVHDPFLGFHLGHAPDLREMGVLYYVLASSETFGDAWRRSARYTGVVNESMWLRYSEGAAVELVVDYVGVPRHVDRHQIEFGMTALLRACRSLTGRALVPTRVGFIHHRNDDPAEVAAFFGCAVEFGATADHMTFDAAVRDIPILSADPYLNELLIANAEAALAQRPTNRASFRSAVENAMVPLLPHGKARVGDIAGKLGMSRRTFARRLAAEGATFSDILEDLRHDLAREYLADQDLSVSQVAWLLGYQETSAFTHAFKRWTGATPREARARET
jgi:AraC-like DNA-binding protein